MLGWTRLVPHNFLLGLEVLGLGGGEAGSLMAGTGGMSITSLGRSKGVSAVEVKDVEGSGEGVSNSPLATLTLLSWSVKPEVIPEEL